MYEKSSSIELFESWAREGNPNGSFAIAFAILSLGHDLRSLGRDLQEAAHIIAQETDRLSKTRMEELHILPQIIDMNDSLASIASLENIANALSEIAKALQQKNT